MLSLTHRSQQPREQLLAEVFRRDKNTVPEVHIEDVDRIVRHGRSKAVCLFLQLAVSREERDTRARRSAVRSRLSDRTPRERRHPRSVLHERAQQEDAGESDNADDRLHDRPAFQRVGD